MINPDQLIKLFQMKPLPEEGGFYVETYRAKEIITQTNLPAEFAGQKKFGSAILYLLTPQTFSRLHRLKSDELFHFYLGDPVTMLHLYPDGSSKVLTLGKDILNNQHIQVTVPKNTWQGCFLNTAGSFALMGCTVAPAFEFADFEQAHRDKLLKQYPNQSDLIIKLTPEK